MDLDSLIRQNEKLMYSVLHKFSLAYDPEAISIGYEALWNAVEKYDGKRASLSTFATICVTNAIYGLLRQRRNPDPIISYDAPISEDGMRLMDILPCDSVDEDYEKEEHYNETLALVKHLVDTMPKSRKKDIVEAWLESDCTKNTVQLGEEFGTSSSHISLTLAEFRARLKKGLQKND